MKALTVKQPWAALIAEGCKSIENRSWQTSHRGPLLIHAGLRFDDNGQAAATEYVLEDDDMPRGVIVAYCNLVLITKDSTSRWAVPGAYHWKLAGVRPLREPIAAKGRQQLWDVPSDVSQEIRGRMLAGTL